MSTPKATCPHCSDQWSGLSACHCSGCHVTFGSEALFSRHRSYGVCGDVVAAGLGEPDGNVIRGRFGATVASRMPKPEADPALPEIGSRVRCERTAPPKGTWSHFAGRVGTVVEHNLGEVGVSFTNDSRAEAWFPPNELVPADSKRATSPAVNMPTSDALNCGAQGDYTRGAVAA